MAIYHHEEKPVKRSAGQSAVNTAAYCMKDKLEDKRIEKKFDYSRQKEEVLFRDTLFPEGCPYRTAEEMWNAVEQFEKKDNAVVGQRVDIAIPKELSQEQAIELAKKFMEARQKEGRGVSFGIHKQEGNLHIDAIYTPRVWDNKKGQWGQKSKSVIMTDRNGNPVLNPKRGKGQPKYKRRNENIDDSRNLTRRRKEWEVFANEALEAAGSKERIDCRSLKAQRLEAEKEYLAGRGSYAKVIELSREPQIHEYHIAERKELNAAIKAGNAELKKVLLEKRSLENQVTQERYNMNRENWKENSNEQIRGNNTEYIITGRSAGLAFSTSLEGQRIRNETFESSTIANVLPKLFERGMANTLQTRRATDMLLPRTESNDMANEEKSGRVERRRTHHTLPASRSMYRRRGYRGRGYSAGSIEIVSWGGLTLAERNAFAEKYPDVRSFNSEQKRKLVKTVFARAKTGFDLLPINQKIAKGAGLMGWHTPRTLNRALKSLEKTGLVESVQTSATCKAVSRDSGTAAKKFLIAAKSVAGGIKQTASAATMGGARSAAKGAFDPNKTGMQHIKEGVQNIGAVCKTPINVIKDIFSNPLTAIFKAPMRAAQALDNTMSAAVNLAVAPVKGNENSKLGDGIGQGKARVRSKEDDALTDTLKDWNLMSQARREDEEHKKLAKLI